MFKFITHRPLWVNILAGIVLALVIFLIFIFSLNWLTRHDQFKTVPQVMGKTFEEAKSTLEKAGFEVEIQDSIYVDTTKPLQVLKQVPEADEQVKINRTVYLTINRAIPPMIDMPNLVGSSFRSAAMTLKNYNLRVGDTTFRPDFAKNAVLEQLYDGNPIKPGSKIRMGSTVDMVLGDGVGDKQFVVPSLVGKTYCEAKAWLESSGLAFGAVVTNGAIQDTCNAFIYRQSPEKFGDDNKFRYIRPGQLMDVWIQADKPVIDSLQQDPPEEN